MRNSNAGFESVELRPAIPDDGDFLRAVFAGTRSDELVLLAGDAKLAKNFIEMQFNAQQQTYLACYPAAENSIILFAEQPIGRMLVDRGKEDLVLVDIAIVSERRNRGIGSFLIRRLMDEAAASQKSVKLSVYKVNPALRLYERLGFSTIEDDGVYLEMKWSP